MKKHFEEIIKSDELNDISIELVEKVLDNGITDEVVKEIPILKSLIAAKKIYNSYTDRIFIEKAMNVLLELGETNWKERVELTSELDDENGTGLGKILLAIDKLETIRKCKVFGRLCKLKALKKINTERFLRLTKLIQDAYIEDLKLLPYFISEQQKNEQKYFNEEEFVPLIALGLIYIQRSEKKSNEKIEEYSKWNGDSEIKGGDTKIVFIHSELGGLLHRYYYDLFPE